MLFAGLDGQQIGQQGCMNPDPPSLPHRTQTRAHRMVCGNTIQAAARAVQGATPRAPQSAQRRAAIAVPSAAEEIHITGFEHFMFTYFGKDSPIIPGGMSRVAYRLHPRRVLRWTRPALPRARRVLPGVQAHASPCIAAFTASHVLVTHRPPRRAESDWEPCPLSAGIFVTAVVLASGLGSMTVGNQANQQTFMRARIVAQVPSLATHCLLCPSSYRPFPPYSTPSLPPAAPLVLTSHPQTRPSRCVP